MSKKAWALLAAVALLLGGIVFMSVNRIMTTLLHSREEVTVPRLEGKSLMDALVIVSPLDLSIQQEGTDYDESLPAGTIIRQRPPSGMQVRAGRAIRVTVSKGGQSVFVPIIEGKPLAEAQSILANMGLQMGSVNEKYSDAAMKTVLKQDPSSGTIVTRGALIDVDASKGPPPEGMPMVPELIGGSAADAQGWAKSANVVVEIREDPRGAGTPGSVLKQNPDAGQPMEEGETLRITIVPSGNAGEAKRINFRVSAAPEGSEASDALVRVIARTNQGESQVYEARHPFGASVAVPVSIASPTRFRIYVDDVLKEERVLEP